LWNVRRQEEIAHALFKRNFDKHVRAILRFWLEQTNERVRPVSPSPRARGRRVEDGGGVGDEDGEDINDGSGDEAGDETQRLEAWTAFDANALGLDANLGFSPFSTSPAQVQTRTQPQTTTDMDADDDFADASAFWSGTPLPPTMRSKTSAGYLKTPSKRSVVRAKRPELPSSPEKRIGAMSAPPVQRRVLELGGNGGAGGLSGVSSFEKRLREGGGGLGTPSVGAGAGAARGAGGGVGLGSALRSARRGVGVERLRRGRVGFGDVSMIG
jgi:protein SFI1